MRWWSLAPGLLVLVACSREGEAGSCFRQPENLCIDFDRSQAAAGKRMCSGLTWTAGEKTCPVAGRLGGCAKAGHVEYLYAGAPNNYAPASAKSACEYAGGTFTAVP
jgi:hypothetical protein